MWQNKNNNNNNRSNGQIEFTHNRPWMWGIFRLATAYSRPFSFFHCSIYGARIGHKSNRILLGGIVAMGTDHRAAVNTSLIGSSKARQNNVKSSWSRIRAKDKTTQKKKNKSHSD